MESGHLSPGLEGDGWELWRWLPGDDKGMEPRAARLGWVSEPRRAAWGHLGRVVTETTPSLIPGRPGVAQPAQTGTGARWGLRPHRRVGMGATTTPAPHETFCDPGQCQGKGELPQHVSAGTITWFGWRETALQGHCPTPSPSCAARTSSQEMGRASEQLVPSPGS